MSVQFKDLNLPDEQLRLEVKELAEDARYKFAKKGITDIFEVVEDMVMLIRKPLDVYDVSGFSTYFEGNFIVCLNSSFTLGHERYTAAHELYHILYNSDLLKKERLSIRDDAFKLEDIKADVFASEFLLPEDYVKKLFFKLVNVDKYKIEARHVVRLNNTLKVSYKAMLKRLVQLGLCDISLYDELKEYGSIEKKEELQEITKLEGYDISLIIPSNVSYISKEYLEIARTNYENGKISYGKISNLLEFINETPEKYGYTEPGEDDIV